jgi:hypothetical protein
MKTVSNNFLPGVPRRMMAIMFTEGKRRYLKAFSRRDRLSMFRSAAIIAGLTTAGIVPSARVRPQTLADQRDRGLR